MTPQELVLAATRWASNASMVLDLVQLGYLRKEWQTLDPTYKYGTWWQLWRPDDLWTNDIDPTVECSWHGDLRDMPFDDASFDAIAYDPPYVSCGGRKTSTIKGYQNRYGIDAAPTTPAGVQDLINDGLIEMYRLVRPGGIVLCKCQDYVSGGRLWTGTYRTQHFANCLGYEVVDRLEHIGNPRPQPGGRRQVHARRNLSTLFVFRKP